MATNKTRLHTLPRRQHRPTRPDPTTRGSVIQTQQIVPCTARAHRPAPARAVPAPRTHGMVALPLLPQLPTGPQHPGLHRWAGWQQDAAALWLPAHPPALPFPCSRPRQQPRQGRQAATAAAQERLGLGPTALAAAGAAAAAVALPPQGLPAPPPASGRQAPGVWQPAAGRPRARAVGPVHASVQACQRVVGCQPVKQHTWNLAIWIA